MAVKEFETPVGLARAHILSRSTRLTVVMGHGAGGGVDAADLQELARLCRARDIGVVLVEQPWRVAGRRVAVSPPQLDAAWLAVVPALRLRGRVVVGGRSAGARVAARTAVPLRRLGLDIAAALLLAFPLHPPGKATSRANELSALRNRVRAVVVQGSGDPFGSADEIRLEAPTATVIEAAGADHAMRLAGANGRAVVAALERAVESVARFGE